MNRDPDTRTRFLRTLSTLDEPAQRHLLKIETVAELRVLRVLATGMTRQIIDEYLDKLDMLYERFERHIGKPRE